MVSPPGVSTPVQSMMLTPPILIPERTWKTVQATPRNTVACETRSCQVAGYDPEIPDACRHDNGDRDQQPDTTLARPVRAIKRPLG